MTQTRSQIMAAVRSSGTQPEARVANALTALGIRSRLQVRSLPGTPDFLIPSAGVVLFVHGCWWHGHACKRGNRTPKTHRDYWVAKVQRNRRRDRRVAAALRAMGYSVWTVWECETRDGLPRRVANLLRRRLGGDGPSGRTRPGEAHG